MIQMLFSLRYQSQLRRTRSNLITSLENAIIRAAEASGAKVRAEYRCITASFDENTIGFGLDIRLVLEAVLQALKKADSELYGHTCIFGRDITEDGPALLRQLPRISGGTGIWCSEILRRYLDPYVVFDESPGNDAPETSFSAYRQIRELKTFIRLGALNSPYSEKIQSVLSSGNSRRAVLMGPGYIGKREALSRFAGTILGDYPPLVIRFGSGGTGLSCFTDALSPPIRGLIPPKSLETLDTIGVFIFKERLEDEFTPFAIRKTGHFLRILLENYISLALNRGISPVILLENIHLANPVAAKVFIDCFAGNFVASSGVHIYGTCSNEPVSVLGNWEVVFPRILQVSPEFLAPPADSSQIPQDLWEIAYAVSLFRQYFPPALFLRLFEEEGKNPVMISRALDMIASMGLLEITEDPLRGARRLGDGKDRIQKMVRNRLLDWVKAGKLRPGFKLLQALADLGIPAPEELVLEALRRDLINGTCSTLRRTIEESRFAELVGSSHIPALLYIFRTLESLLRGNDGDIAAAFAELPPEEEVPSYKVRLLSYMAIYKLGIHDTDKAAELIKDAMHISQGQSGNRGLAQAYRVFSLVNLSKGRLSDAIEYFSFSMEQAEKSEDFEEYALSAYYAAAAQFLFGNIAKAERLALKAEETALNAGLSAWADRARFLRGKLLFESGRYKESLDMFTELQHNSFGLHPAAADTLEAWAYRSAVFLGSDEFPAQLATQFPNTDARFFEIEASYLAEDYQRTVELSDKLLGELPDQEFLFIEQPDWRSGFSQGELLLFSLKEFRSSMISAYRALALCRLDKAGHADARRSIELIIRDERLSDMDPNSAFYFFAYYCILGESGAHEVDMDTAVSMAYKRLQRRASRIDDAEINRSFLSRHYWNGALSRAAKEHKLI
ncbi:hypothetical protein LQZ19_18570 [Treponema primitia]|uniref:hypothetical protein n=1 Tax=Treponema primitia TaxID=88058 RepID=UPI00397EDCDD